MEEMIFKTKLSLHITMGTFRRPKTTNYFSLSRYEIVQAVINVHTIVMMCEIGVG